MVCDRINLDDPNDVDVDNRDKLDVRGLANGDVDDRTSVANGDVDDRTTLANLVCDLCSVAVDDPSLMDPSASGPVESSLDERSNVGRLESADSTGNTPSSSSARRSSVASISPSPDLSYRVNSAAARSSLGLGGGV